MSNHYEILGVDKDCSKEDIKNAFRSLAKEYHPDKNKNKGLSDEELKEVNAKYKLIHKAFEVLSDPELREEYDKSGISSAKGETLLNPAEAMMMAMDRKDETGVPDVIVSINATIQELYDGFSKDVNYERISPCQKCKATGTKDKKNGDCTNCKGRGCVLEHIEGGDMGYMYKESACDFCRGTGLDPDVKKCKKCEGNKYYRETIDCSIDIPKGAYEGYYVKLALEGNYIPKENRTDKEVERSDALFVIDKVDYGSEFPIYRRGVVIKELNRANRADLMLTIPISFEESLCGITKKIMHLDGSEIEIEIDESVVNADIIAIEGRGMPVVDNEDDKYGDLFIKFEVKRPELDTHTKKKLWQILTNTSYQKREKLECPESYVFLDSMISDAKTKQKAKSYAESDADSDADSDDSNTESDD